MENTSSWAFSRLTPHVDRRSACCGSNSRLQLFGSSPPYKGATNWVLTKSPTDPHM
ncbi:hypothetical protein D3C80_1735000 [compost metagenome]